MALPSVNITLSNGNLAQLLPGTDHISGLLVYQATLPSGFASDARIKVVGSISEAEALGITAGGATTKHLHYQIRSFFKIAPGALLYVGIYAIPAGAHDFAEFTTMCRFSNKSIKRIGVLTPKAYDSAKVAALQVQCTLMRTENTPTTAFLSADTSDVADFSSLADIRSGANIDVAVLVGQDGDKEGATLSGAGALDMSITAMGYLLGVRARGPISSSIAEVGAFNVNVGVDMTTPALGNGILVNTLSNAVLSALSDKGYIFLRKFEGNTGTFFSDSVNAAAATSDFNYIERTEVVNKVHRLAFQGLLPLLSSRIRVVDSKLVADDIASFQLGVSNALQGMVNDGDISDFGIFIDPAQNVISTSTIAVVIQIVPVGIARTIAVNLGFALTIN